VVPCGSLTAGSEAPRGAGLLRGIGVVLELAALAPGAGAAAPVVPEADVRERRVQALAAGGPATVRPAGMGVGPPVGGLIKPAAVRAAGRLGSGLIGPGGLRAARKPGSGRTGPGSVRAVPPATVARGTGARVRRTGMIAG
jgi:hypothetical protein